MIGGKPVNYTLPQEGQGKQIKERHKIQTQKHRCVCSGFLIHIMAITLLEHVTQGMTSGPSGKGPSVNRVSSMLVVLGPLPAMDMLPGNA